MTKKTTPSDQQLIVEAQKGDFEAFRMIVLRYSNALLSVAYSILGDFHEAQDVTQESFVKCYNHLHTLKDPTRLGSWLYSIAYRTSLDFVKKRKPSLPFDEMNAKPRDDTHLWLDRYVIQESINTALQSLEERSKAAVILHYLGDWSMKEIGQFLSLSVSAVESRIRRARETLRHYLADDFEACFQPYRLGHQFEQMVCEKLLKRMGHFYIPVKNKRQATDWFIYHFHLKINAHGNLLLESGHELYLLECYLHTPRNMPLLTFSVSNADELRAQLISSGVTAEQMETTELFGKLFAFYDPDYNKYYAVENN